MCVICEKTYLSLLYFTLILGSVFSDCVVFYVDYYLIDNWFLNRLIHIQKSFGQTWVNI